MIFRDITYLWGGVVTPASTEKQRLLFLVAVIRGHQESCTLDMVQSMRRTRGQDANQLGWADLAQTIRSGDALHAQAWLTRCPQNIDAPLARHQVKATSTNEAKG